MLAERALRPNMFMIPLPTPPTVGTGVVKTLFIGLRLLFPRFSKIMPNDTIVRADLSKLWGKPQRW